MQPRFNGIKESPRGNHNQSGRRDHHAKGQPDRQQEKPETEEQRTNNVGGGKSESESHDQEAVRKTRECVGRTSYAECAVGSTAIFAVFSRAIRQNFRP
jgi:hypothetical protein